MTARAHNAGNHPRFVNNAARTRPTITTGGVEIKSQTGT